MSSLAALTGFWSTNAADKNHEPGIKEAVRQMLGVTDSTTGNTRALNVLYHKLAIFPASSMYMFALALGRM